MTLFTATIIAPDSSHWGKWLDAAQSPNPERRRRAHTLHGRLLEQGRLPLLSWHHLEELLGVENDSTARTRIEFLQQLPFVAYLRLPNEKEGLLGSIVQVLAAEAIAAAEGCGDLIAVRNRARELLLTIGNGRQAIGEDIRVWEASRPNVQSRKGTANMIATFGPLRTFDEKLTIGELAKLPFNSPDQIRMQLDLSYARALREAILSTGGDTIGARKMADEFMTQVLARTPPPGATVREMLVLMLVDQGVDESEIRDESVLEDLNRLALFRSQLRVVASKTGRSFQELKKVSMDVLPSRVISEALKVHGQPRSLRPGSDHIDSHLAVLAAYCTVLYVDKRTAEDFRRARNKEPRLTGLIGDIAKAGDFEGLLA
ncbi:hypothetical protein [Acidocella sp. KAb 2-4]|uniref:hypothetical protein n=1 Tax=Acidocella sp. KAb 2-4 TaxID=2885158 RepID=UPI001D061847|nr:hypothetical protein [Acidocella sp. KAb 2-4]MCB5943952.1 hypothetical protein [Acidocella sp. KAb 2-4]